MKEYRVLLSATTQATAEVVVKAENEEEAKALAMALDDLDWQATIGEEQNVEVDEVEPIEEEDEL